MADLIVFRCPHTGMNVQADPPKQESNEDELYEAITCHACGRLHFIRRKDGKS